MRILFSFYTFGDFQMIANMVIMIGNFKCLQSCSSLFSVIAKMVSCLEIRWNPRIFPYCQNV